MAPIGKAAASLGKADIHIHSAAGDGVTSPAGILEYVENHTDLDVIAITDHDEIAGSLEARELAARNGYRFQVIPGLEVTTREGHLLALFVEQRIPMLRSLEATIEAVHALGGLCIVPHPMSWLTLSVGRRRLVQLCDKSSGFCLDGIETFNPTIAGRVAWQAASALNREVLQLAETGGSDAHQAKQVGTARTLFPGRTSADFREALIARTTVSDGTFWSARDHLHGAAQQQWRSMVVHPYRKIARAVGRESSP
ncbi:MAG: hypothetical protein M0Z94_10400 [Dehalococcoidales bacterium]|nr:hypothetical protein [Dehalococcoidales bacterium]